jgi:sodium pump decarboxylase gamma subunit
MLGFGLTVAAIGIGTVFTELILLVFVIYAISGIANIITGKKPKAGASTAEQNVAQPAVVQAQEENDDSIIAVIAATIASLNMGSVKITAIRRINGVSGPAWSHAGRVDTMNSRQV